MKKNYFKRAMLVLGAAAMVSVAYAEKTYVDITRQYIQEPSFVPGWQGAIGAANGQVGEIWDGAFNLYQNLGEMPAGKYVLTANAFYRCGNNDYAKENQAGNEDLNTAFIYINDAKAVVKNLWEGRETAPNSMDEANEAFSNGEYVNTVEYQHNGGELIIGICNTGSYQDEWCCFDNFVLTCDGAPVDAIINGDFSYNFDAKRAWNNANSAGSEKTPDSQKDGSGGGSYRKCGGSPYNTGQQVELPAGSYRFSMLCFHRYGSTMDENGVYYRHKWPLGPTEAYGSMNRTPKDWFDANDYDEVGDEMYAHAYIYMSKNEAKPKSLAWSESEAEGDLNEATDVRTRVKDCWEICNGDFATMPDNNPRFGPAQDEEGNWPDYGIKYDVKNKCTNFHDSGNEREATGAFVNEPEKWRQGVEFTLEEPTKVWLGLGKDENSGDGYWHAYADIKLEKIVDGAGIGSAVEDVNMAPVEYYTISGVRVLNPTNGFFIVKQGTKVSKRYIR